jgi:hypothetical protein
MTESRLDGRDIGFIFVLPARRLDAGRAFFDFRVSLSAAYSAG